MKREYLKRKMGKSARLLPGMSFAQQNKIKKEEPPDNLIVSQESENLEG